MARKTVTPASTDAVLEIPGADVTVGDLSQAHNIVRKRIESGDSRAVQMQVPLRKQAEPMRTRWANTSITGRAYELSNQKGWVPVRYDELQNPGAGEFQRSPDGLVSRGTNGHQVLYKIPESWYKEVTAAKASRLNKQLGSRSQMSAGAANAMQVNQADNDVARVGVETFDVSKSSVDLEN